MGNSFFAGGRKVNCFFPGSDHRFVWLFFVLAWGGVWLDKELHGFCQEKEIPQKKSVDFFVSPPASLFVCVSSYLLCSPFLLAR